MRNVGIEPLGCGVQVPARDSRSMESLLPHRKSQGRELCPDVIGRCLQRKRRESVPLAEVREFTDVAFEFACGIHGVEYARVRRQP